MQPTLKDWLARKPKGKAPKKRIPAMSAKRKKEAAIYSKKRKAFLEANPSCAFLFCYNVSTDVHHKAGRLSGNYLDESTWLPVCRRCHDWIHNNPKEARVLGLLA